MEEGREGGKEDSPLAKEVLAVGGYREEESLFLGEGEGGDTHSHTHMSSTNWTVDY